MFPLNAMRRPQHLFKVAQADDVADSMLRVFRGEGLMVRRMPVLRCHHDFVLRNQLIHGINDLVAAGHGQRAAWQEIVLHVDDQQGFQNCALALVGREQASEG